MEYNFQPVNWLVFTDGSPSSQDGLELTTKCLMRQNDKITVSHIFDFSKEYLPYQFKPENIKQNVEAQLLPFFQPGQWNLHWQAKSSGYTTQELMISIAEQYRSDFMVLGYLGRKGAKIDSTRGGTAVVSSLQRSPCNTIICKKALLSQEEGLNWVCCVDRSDLSQKAFELAVQLHRPGLDIIKVVYLYHQEKGMGINQKIKDKYQSLIQQYNINASVEILEQGKKNKADMLCEYIREQGTDIVTLGKIGKNKEQAYKKKIGLATLNIVGSLTEAITERAKCNVLLAVNY